MSKSYAQMRLEAVESAELLGWKHVDFDDAVVLLHSEVSEILEAWRQWGFNDMTGPTESYVQPPKPEGVGSEFADLFIRLLHYDAKFHLDLEMIEVPGAFGMNLSFTRNLNALHQFIAMAYSAYDLDGCATLNVRVNFAKLLAFIYQLIAQYNIDLAFEYERKMAYNRTRPYRHGGKKI